jgi:hypothetical protein
MRFRLLPCVTLHLSPILVGFVIQLFSERPRRSSSFAVRTHGCNSVRLCTPSYCSSVTQLFYRAVYFNPAKTRGGMFEADVYCVLGLLYTSVVSLCSMSMFWWLDVIPGLEWLAVALVLLWIGVSMSAVAWTKVWMNKPSFNPGAMRFMLLVLPCSQNCLACSMISIILFVVYVVICHNPLLDHLILLPSGS